MKRNTGLLLLVISVFAACVQADEPNKRRTVLEYFELTGVVESLKRQMETTKTEARGHYAGYPPVFWEDLDRLYDRYEADVLNAYVDVADENLSTSELESIMDFLATEPGQKFLSISKRLQPKYDEATAAVYADWLDDLQDLVDEHAP